MATGNLSFADALWQLQKAHEHEIAATRIARGTHPQSTLASTSEAPRKQNTVCDSDAPMPEDEGCPAERDPIPPASVCITIPSNPPLASSLLSPTCEAPQARLPSEGIRSRATSAGLNIAQLNIARITTEANRQPSLVRADSFAEDGSPPTSPRPGGEASPRYTLKGHWEAFEQIQDTPNNGRGTSRKKGLSRARTVSEAMNSPSEASSQAERIVACSCHMFISLPDAAWRLCWDVIGTFLIGWDVIFIPLQVFDIPASLFLSVMGWIITLFWSCDIAFSFFVGFYAKGILIMSPKKIARRYMSSWLVLDVLVVTGDWMDALGSSDGVDVSKFGRVTRIVRTIRVIRLLRLLKLKKLLNDMQEHIYTEYAFILTTVCKLVVFILATNHFVACLWYLVGSNGGSSSWVAHNFGAQAEVGYRYTTSLHWSLTQFMPASMEVNPKNWVERAFAIMVLFIGMITFSSFVANITNSMMNLRNLGAEDNKQLWLLRRFLKQRDIPFTLVLRVTTYLEYKCATQKKRIQERDIRLLALLSQPLKDELHYEFNIPLMRGHPLFDMLCTDLEVLMHRLCRTALQSHSLAYFDTVFDSGEAADRMYFFLVGGLTYTFADGNTLDPPIQVGEWICEATLWTSWRNMGELRAASESELLSIDASEFSLCVSNSANAWAVVSVYAHKFLVLLNSMDAWERVDVIRKETFYVDLIEGSGFVMQDKQILTSTGSPQGAATSSWKRFRTIVGLY